MASFYSNIKNIFKPAVNSPVGKIVKFAIESPLGKFLIKTAAIADFAVAGWQFGGNVGETVGGWIGGAKGAAWGKKWGGPILAGVVGVAAIAAVVFGGPEVAVIASQIALWGTVASVATVVGHDLWRNKGQLGAVVTNAIHHPLSALKYIGSVLDRGMSFNPLTKDFWKDINTPALVIDAGPKPLVSKQRIPVSQSTYAKSPASIGVQAKPIASVAHDAGLHNNKTSGGSAGGVGKSAAATTQHKMVRRSGPARRQGISYKSIQPHVALKLLNVANRAMDDITPIARLSLDSPADMLLNTNPGASLQLTMDDTAKPSSPIAAGSGTYAELRAVTKPVLPDAATTVQTGTRGSTATSQPAVAPSKPTNLFDKTRLETAHA